MLGQNGAEMCRVAAAGDAVGDDEPVKQGKVLAGFLRNGVKRAANGKDRIQVLHGGVERERGVAADAALGGVAPLPRYELYEVRLGTVGNHNALGLAGGA